MKIAIDASQINQDRAGIGNVMRGLLEGFREFPQHQFVVFAREEMDKQDIEGFESRVRPDRPKWQGGGFRWYWELGRELNREKVDCLISVSASTAALFFPRTLQIIHDLTPLSSPQFFTPGHNHRFALAMRAIAGRARWIVSVSQTTAEVFQKYFPDTKRIVRVMPLGLNTWVRHQPRSEEVNDTVAWFDLPEMYLLSVGTVQPRKNHLHMLQAFAEIAADYPKLQYLIGGGKGWMFEQIYEAVQDLGLEDKVRFLGYVEERHMPTLYDRSAGFMYASFDEGFGLPVLEALARGVPVLTSDLPVFRELVDENTAVLVDPFSVKDIAVGISKLLEQSKRAPDPELFRAHDWKLSARILLELVSGVVEK